MIREALVVGINRYPFLKDATGKALPLLKAAEDAEAVAQILETYGNFRVRRLPEIYLGETRRVDNKQLPPNLPGAKQLEKAISELFNPPSQNPPDTALLFFAGHGFPKDPDGISEGFLATCDVNIENEKFGVSFNWLRDVLDKSPVGQQIVILDCCHSGEFINLFKAESPSKKAEQKYTSRCFIAASRDFEAAYEHIGGDHGLLTSVLLDKLNPDKEPDGWVDNYRLVDFINKQLAKFPQQPVFYNAGGEIIMTGQKQIIDKKILDNQICPYKGLESFELEDADYFYGREKLTDELLNKVWSGNFLAVVGASGSGKSSVVKAGLLYEIKQGLKRSGTQNWQILTVRPNQHPFESLARAFKTTELTGELQVKAEELRQSGVEGFVQYVRAIAGSEKLLLVIDQFEECFTLCNDLAEREEFFKCLFEGLERLQNKLCIVITMRSDFFDKCMERGYSGLAHKIKENLVPVMPMTREELEEAITKPAEKVGSEVMSNLVEQMLNDVEGPGSLPLLEFTLRQLWDLREFNRLTLAEYKKLGRVKGALENKANDTYTSLSKSEQKTAKRIFLELTHLGEGTEDTRRQVLKSNLITEQASEEVVNNVLDKLTKAGLLVTNEVKRGEENSESVMVVDVTHEALIRSWGLLRKWLDENRALLRKQRIIEEDAIQWKENNKSSAYLLRGLQLQIAEDFAKNNTERMPLSSLGREFVNRSIDKRKKELWLQFAAAGLVLLVSVLGLFVTTRLWSKVEKESARAHKAEIEKNKAQFKETAAKVQQKLLIEPVNSLVQIIDTTSKSRSLLGQVLPEVQNSLVEAVKTARETNLLKGDQGSILSVAMSDDGTTIVNGGSNGTVGLWNASGKPIGSPFKGHQDQVNSVTMSGDGKTIVTGGYDRTVRLWDSSGKPIGSPFQSQQGWVWSVAMSGDGKTIVTGGYDGTVRLWDSSGKPIGSPFKGHQGAVRSVAMSGDGKIIISGGDDSTVRVWDSSGKAIASPFKGHQGSVYSVAMSGDGKIIVSGGDDGTLRFWSASGEPIATALETHQGEVWSVAMSGDGKIIVSGGDDGTVRLWDSSGKAIGSPFKGHQGAVRSVAMSGDGNTIVSGGDDSTVRLWDSSGKAIGSPFQGDEDVVSSMVMSGDGKTIVSGGEDDTVGLWDGTWETWLEVGCNRLRQHPVFANPASLKLDSEQLKAAKGAKETCEKYVWSGKK